MEHRGGAWRLSNAFCRYTCMFQRVAHLRIVSSWNSLGILVRDLALFEDGVDVEIRRPFQRWRILRERDRDITT